MGPEIIRTASAMTGIGACAIGLVAAVAAYSPVVSTTDSGAEPRAVIPETVASTTPRRAMARGGIIGTLYFSQDNNPDGLHRIDPLDGTTAAVGASGVTSVTVGLAPTAALDALYGSRPRGLLVIDASGAGAERFGSVAMEGMAYDRSGDDVYAAGAGTEFFTVDPDTGTILADLPSPGVDLEGLAFGNGGVYGLAGASGRNLYFYSPSQGAWTIVGDTGIAWVHAGLAFNECANVLYAKGSQDTFIYTLLPETGETLHMSDTGLSRGGGLAWSGTCPPPPCDVEDITRDGTVDFIDVLRLLTAWGDCPPGSGCPKPGSCRGGFESGCAGDPDCACIELFDGTSQCHRDFGCTQTCPDGTCPPGFHCVRDSCCGETTCAPDEAICGLPGPACVEDVNGDQGVDFADVLQVLGAWGPCGNL